MESRQFWISPGMESPQLPLATSASAQSSSQELFLMFNLCFSLCLLLLVLPQGTTETLALSSAHSPSRHIYTSIRGSLSLFSCERSSSYFIIFMVFHKSLSSMSLSLLKWGTQSWAHHFRSGHCWAQGKGHLPWHAGSHPANAAQDNVSLVCHRDTWLPCFPLGNSSFLECCGFCHSVPCLGWGNRLLSAIISALLSW